MSDDLIADLRQDYPHWMEDEQPGEVIAAYKTERSRAAAALDAKDAEIVTLDRMISDICAELDCVHDQEVALQAVATLRARLAAAEKALTTISTLPMPEQDNMLGANMRKIAYDALVKEAPSDD